MIIQVYKCDQCGKVGPWVSGWASRVYCFGHREAAWEEDIHTCSNECRKKWEEETTAMKKKQLLQYIYNKRKEYSH